MLNQQQELRRRVVEILSMEDLVPKDHLLRQIDGAVDFIHIYDFVEELYCKDNGRPMSTFVNGWTVFADIAPALVTTKIAQLHTTLAAWVYAY